MENVIYNELRIRGYNVDIGNLLIAKKVKMVIMFNTPKLFYNDEGILFMSVFDFLLKPNSLEI